MTDYYDLVTSGQVPESYDRTSPGFQARQSRSAYANYFENELNSVEVVGSPKGGNDGSVDLVLDYERADGTRTREDVTITFVRGGDGELLLDSYRVRRSVAR